MVSWQPDNRLHATERASTLVSTNSTYLKVVIGGMARPIAIYSVYLLNSVENLDSNRVSRDGK
jgi:hypothetical protein